jgi:hypothetical protein
VTIDARPLARSTLSTVVASQNWGVRRASWAKNHERIVCMAKASLPFALVCGESEVYIYENNTSKLVYVDLWVNNTGDCNVIVRGMEWNQPRPGTGPWGPGTQVNQLITVSSGETIRLFGSSPSSGNGQLNFEWEVRTVAVVTPPPPKVVVGKLVSLLSRRGWRSTAPDQ